MEVIAGMRVFKTNYIRFVLLLLVLAISNVIYGQSPSIKLYNTENGLPQNTVYGIISDPSGYLWVSTADGIARFNGQVFQTFHNETHLGLSLNPVGKIAIDTRGGIWQGRTNGLFHYSNYLDAQINIPKPESIASEQWVTNVIATEGDTIWIVVNGDNLFAFNYKKMQWNLHGKIFKQDPSDNIVDGFKDGNDFVFQSFWRRLKYNINQRKITMEKFVKSSMYIGIAKGYPSGYVAIESGRLIKVNIHTLDAGVYNFKGFPDNEEITCIYAANQILWIGTRKNGIYKVDLKSEVVVGNFKPGSGLADKVPDYLCKSMFQDAHGLLWVGFDGGGLIRINEHAGKLGAIQSNLPKSGFIRGFATDKEHNLWVVSYKGGLFKYSSDLKNCDLLHEKYPSIRNAEVNSILIDKTNRIWISNSGGAYWLLPNGNLEHIPMGELPKYDVEYLFSAPNNHIYLADKYNIYLYSEAEKIFKKIRKNISPLSVYVDHRNRMWISNFWGSLEVYNCNNAGIPDTQKLAAFFKSLNARGMTYSAKDKLFFISTEKGVQVVDENLKFVRKYGIAEGMANEFVYSVQLDEKGNCWAATNKGLSCILEGSNRVLNFGLADGVQGNEFNTRAFFTLPDQRLIFGGMTGFNIFNPSQTLQLPAPFRLTLEGIYTRNKSVCVDSIKNAGILKMDHTQNSLNVQFFLNDFIAPEFVKYRYKLEGGDNTWTELGNKNAVFLSSLAPGNYILWVDAKDHFGRDTGPVKLLQFVIAPPFYQTWWFIVLLFATVGIIVFLITRYLYLQKVKSARAEAEKIRSIHAIRLNISRELHDNLGASISRVSLLSNKLKNSAGNIPEASAVGSISRIANEMTGQIKNIVWNINNEYDNLESLIAYLRSYSVAFLEENSIQYELDLPEEVPVLNLYMEVRQSLFALVSEALNNAVKYSSAKKIWVQFVVLPHDQFELVVRDNGIGFDTTHSKPFANGLKNMRNRMEELGYTFTMVSAPGKGCEIRVKGNLKSHI